MLPTFLDSLAVEWDLRETSRSFLPMTLPLLVAGFFTTLYRGIYGILDRDEKKMFLDGALIGGLVGAVCGIPMVILAINRNHTWTKASPLFWTNVGAGALGGFCLAIPFGIGTFLYVLEMEKK